MIFLGTASANRLSGVLTSLEISFAAIVEQRIQFWTELQHERSPPAIDYRTVKCGYVKKHKAANKRIQKVRMMEKKGKQFKLFRLLKLI